MLSIGHPQTQLRQGLRLCQCAANTIADRTKPIITLMIAPALNARNGRLPALASSRKRVVSPMLRKQKMKAQVRKSLTGATNPGPTVLLKSARLYEAVTAVKNSEAIRKPRMNL